MTRNTAPHSAWTVSSRQPTAHEMKTRLLLRAVAMALTLTMVGSAHSQSPPSRAEGAAPAAPARVSTEILKGTWLRPDGGYRIVIHGVGADGKLEATYFNPARLPFARAQVTQERATFRVMFELQAGGYAGSTYDLVYDPSTDRLKGTYYQAVAKQRFDVYFVRN